jgi:hypothetical protein
LKEQIMETLVDYSVFDAPLSDFSQRQSAQYVAIIPLYLALIAGTGGAYAANNIQIANQFVSQPIVCVLDGRSQKTNISKTSEQVSHIRRVFGMTMSDLASAFAVARPTAYAWLQGAEPRQEITDKMWMLSSWADDFERAGMSQLSLYLHRPLIQGKTLLALITSGQQLDEAFSRIRDISSADSMSRISVKRQEGRRRENSNIADISSVITELG